MALNQQVFTNAGEGMWGAAQTGGTLTITRIVVGSGTAATDADLYPLTSLIDWQSDVTISRQTDLGGGRIIVSGVLTEAMMSAGSPFSLRELGLMAKIGSGAEQLYTVSNVYADSPDTVTPGGTATHAFDITIQIGRATSVTITIGDPDSIDVQNIPSDSTVGPGVFDKRSGNVFYFKRLIAGPGIALTDGDDDGITIGVETITANLDLYVPPTNPLCPGPSVAFATVQAALDYLAPFIIPPDKTVTIHIDQGTFTSSASITIDHPNAKQIYLLGLPRVDKTIVQINYLDATHKNVSVTDATGLVAGQYCYIANSTGGWAGGCKITAIAGTVVTVSTLKRDTQATFTTNDHNTGRRLSFYPTVMVLNDVGRTLFNISCPNGIGGLTDLTLVGGAACVSLKGENFVSNLSCWSASAGISGDIVHLTGEVVVTDCDFGLTGNTFYGFEQIYINSCGVGVACQSASLGSQAPGEDAAALYLAHNGNALQLSVGQVFRGGTLVASSNDNVVYVDVNSTAYINPGGYASGIDNNGLVLLAQGRSYIQYARNGGATPSCSPTAETLGNNNSLVHII